MMKQQLLCLLIVLLCYISKTLQDDFDAEITTDELPDSRVCLYHECICDVFDDDENDKETRLRCVEGSLTQNSSYAHKNFALLEFQGIQKIQDFLLSSLSVKKLVFRNNKIQDIDSLGFSGVSDVEELDLSFNEIGCNRTLEENVFSYLGELQALNLESNCIGDLDHNAQYNVFGTMKRLRVLNLNFNKVTKASLTYILASLNLTHLHLRRNLISSIDKDWTSSLSKLVLLDLSENYIGTIAEGTFDHLKKLEHLHLSKNHIKHIPSNLFLHLGVLENLDLSYQLDDFQSIDDFSFDRIVSTAHYSYDNLLKIELNGNKIKRISDKAFCVRNSGYIDQIDLKDNPLRDFNVCTFIQMITKDANDRVSIRLPKAPCSCDATYLGKLFNLGDSECVTSGSQTEIAISKHLCLDFDAYLRNKTEECKQERYSCGRAKSVDHAERKHLTSTIVYNENINPAVNKATLQIPGLILFLSRAFLMIAFF